MSIQELEKAVTELSKEELTEFAQWFADFRQEDWDRQIQEDSDSGRLDKLLQKAQQYFETGYYRAI